MNRVELIKDAEIVAREPAWTEVYNKAAPMWAAILDTDIEPKDIPACLTLLDTAANKVFGTDEVRCVRLATYAADTAELAEYDEDED